VARTGTTSTRFVARFLQAEAGGGVVLFVAAVTALAWANSPWDGSYHDVFTHDVRHWVNDGLMAVFFFVVGLEIKRELVTGELRDRRVAAVPAVAALGGMVVPALLYYLVARDQGWGIPMATDIAFAVGVMALVGRRVGPSLKLFLLTLAVVDDIGAVLVIALFYGGGLHPAVVAVALGLAVPVRWGERLERLLHPWSAFVVVPVFALANAGVPLAAEVDSRIAGGIVLGLVVGKPLGITLAAWAAVRLGLGRLPRGATWPQVAATGAVAGVGFTVSLFVAGLAFEADPGASVAVMAASACAALLGGLGLTFWGAKT
jgi:NhaA family Na+:H+ antiporter